MIKYILVPNYVQSIYDTDKHYYGPGILARLYNVNPQECVVVSDAPGESLHQLQRWYPEAKVLQPRFNGDYIEHRAQLEGVKI